MAAKDTKLLSVRLPEADRRRIKTLAASQGLTLREALGQAFEAWASQLQSAAPTPGAEWDASAALDGKKPGRPKRAATL